MQVNKLFIDDLIEKSDLVADSFYYFENICTEKKIGASLWKHKNGRYWIQSVSQDQEGMLEIEFIKDEDARQFCYGAEEAWVDLEKVLGKGWVEETRKSCE